MNLSKFGQKNKKINKALCNISLQIPSPGSEKERSYEKKSKRKC
jgi:hypothetical protein